MQVETLEVKLRENGLLSEGEIQQVLSFIFSLDKSLPDMFVSEMRSYVKKYIVFSSINAYKAIAEKDPPQEFANTVGLALEGLGLKLSKKEFSKGHFMDEAEKVIINLIAERKKKIVGVSSLAFEETLSILGLDKDKADGLKESFSKNLLLLLNKE